MRSRDIWDMVKTRPDRTGRCSGCLAHPVGLWDDLETEGRKAYCVLCWKMEAELLWHRENLRALAPLVPTELVVPF